MSNYVRGFGLYDDPVDFPVEDISAAEKKRVYSWLNLASYQAPVSGEGYPEKLLRQVHNIYYQNKVLLKSDLSLAQALHVTLSKNTNVNAFISFSSQFIQGIKARIQTLNMTPPPLIIVYQGPADTGGVPSVQPYDPSGSGDAWGPTPAATGTGTAAPDMQTLLNKYLPYALLFFGATIALQLVTPKTSGRRRY